MKRWMGIALAGLLTLLAGCGGDGSDRPKQQTFDLTGHWVTAGIACETSSAALPPEALAGMNGQIEHETLASPGATIAQDGSTLVITDLETGDQTDGTIVGDMVSYVESEEGEFAGVTGASESMFEGMVVDPDTIEGTVGVEWEFTAEGMTFMGETVCDVRFERTE